MLSVIGYPTIFAYMKRIVIGILIAFVLLSSTCKKAMQVPDPELTKIFGKWNWISTSGGFAGKIRTPSNMGYTVRVEFSNAGIYQVFKNDTLTDKKKISFSKRKSIRSDKQVWVVSYEPLPDIFKDTNPALPAEVSFSGQDTLMLNDYVYDGFTYTYVRIK